MFIGQIKLAMKVNLRMGSSMVQALSLMHKTNLKREFGKMGNSKILASYECYV